MPIDIENYINSLNNDITYLNIASMKITHLPNLTRFTNLKIINCFNNLLTSIPELPKNLKELYCHNNKLVSLPSLNENLEHLDCSNNELTVLPKLNKKLKEILCFNNKFSNSI